jgi:hypothetical protein
MWDLDLLLSQLESAHQQGVFEIVFDGYIVPTCCRHTIRAGFGRYVKRSCRKAAT